MNLEKMRHQLGRSTPDVMWKNFDRLTTTHEETQEWIANFGRMMKYKHGANVKNIEVFASDMTDTRTPTVRFQIHVRLWDVKKSHRKRITIHPEMMNEPRTQSSDLCPNESKFLAASYAHPSPLLYPK